MSLSDHIAPQAAPRDPTTPTALQTQAVGHLRDWVNGDLWQNSGRLSEMEMGRVLDLLDSQAAQCRTLSEQRETLGAKIKVLTDLTLSLSEEAEIRVTYELEQAGRIEELERDLADEREAREMLDEELYRVSGVLSAFEESPHSRVSTHVAEIVSRVAALSEENGALLRFAGEAITDTRTGDIGDWDGGDIQEALEASGLIARVTVTEPCSEENCACAEYGDFPLDCFHTTDLGRRATAAARSASPLSGEPADG